jgi:hypothetical protein
VSGRLTAKYTEGTTLPKTTSKTHEGQSMGVHNLSYDRPGCTPYQEAIELV